MVLLARNDKNIFWIAGTVCRTANSREIVIRAKYLWLEFVIRARHLQRATERLPSTVKSLFNYSMSQSKAKVLIQGHDGLNFSTVWCTFNSMFFCAGHSPRHRHYVSKDTFFTGTLCTKPRCSNALIYM